jgi:hypothetical protein
VITRFRMRGQTVLSRKKRGPAPTGKGTLIGVRLQPPQLSAIDAWAASQEPQPSRPEAIRALVEAMLHILAKDPGETPAGKPGSRTQHAADAAGMAGREIDRLSDKGATDDERASRKRRLLKGPKEFREMRGQRPKG